MKKLIIVIVLIIIVTIVIYIMSTKMKINNIENQNKLIEQNTKNDIDNNVKTGEIGYNMENVRIKLIFNNEEIYIKLNNSQTSKDFLNILPLTLKFEDYNNTEKIGTLPKKLSTEDAPSGYDPEIGDFSYYAPWGNLCIFYKDFGHSSSLVKLGTLESGIEKLENIKDDFTVRIEISN